MTPAAWSTPFGPRSSRRSRRSTPASPPSSVAAQCVQPYRLRPGPRGGQDGRRLAALRRGALRREGAGAGKGWPYTEASVLFKDRISDHDATSVARLRKTGRRAGRADDGQRVRRHQLHLDRAARHDPQPLEPRAHPGRLVGRHGRRGGRRTAADRAPGATAAVRSGSRPASAGSSASRRPTGAFRRGPTAGIQPMTTVLGCLTRSVRDTARYFDACNGFDQRDPLSLPAVGGWEAGLGSHDLSGMTAAILRRPRHRAGAGRGGRLVVGGGRATGRSGRVARRRPCTPTLPPLRGQWAMANQPAFVADLGDAYPDGSTSCRREMRHGARGRHGALHAREGGLDRGVPPPAQRGHGGSLRAGRLRHVLDAIPTWPSRPKGRRHRPFPAPTSFTRSGSPAPS